MTTPECTGNTGKAVVRGADVVAYWSIEPGHHAVYGSKEFSSRFGRYLFYFSSLENKLEFEVGPKCIGVLLLLSQELHHIHAGWN